MEDKGGRRCAASQRTQRRPRRGRRSPGRRSRTRGARSRPRASILDYAATKGAIVTFTKGLAQELIHRGIRVNCVAPGPVWTPLIAQSFSEERVKSFGESSPMERPAQPSELAPAFVFLASEESRYVNGEVLGVTGGQLLA